MTAITLPKLMNKAEIEKAIVSIATRGKKLDADIQLAGLSILKHVQDHGDVTLADTLFNSMAKGSRRNALAAWMVEHGKLMLNVGEDRKARPFLFDRDNKTRLEDAAATPWYDFMPEKDVLAELDVSGLVAALLKKVDAAAKSNTPIVGVTDEQLATLRGMAKVAA